MYRYRKALLLKSVMAAEDAYRQIKNDTHSNFAVIKAQIHAGGRGKGTIIGTEQRGVKVAKSLDDVTSIASNLLGGTLVTIQTGPAGKKVSKILIAQDVYYGDTNKTKEFYLSILLDRAKGKMLLCTVPKVVWTLKKWHRTHPGKNI